MGLALTRRMWGGDFGANEAHEGGSLALTRPSLGVESLALTMQTGGGGGWR